jgi:hypothetical protein
MKFPNTDSDDLHNILEGINTLILVGAGIMAVLALVAVALGVVGGAAYAVLAAF